MVNWYVANVSIIFDAPCLFITNYSIFTRASGCFYGVYVTNILTRCHRSSSLFSAIFDSRKVTKEIFAELEKEFTESHILPKASWSQMGRPAGCPGGAHLPQERVGPWPRLAQVWPPWPASGSALPPIYSSRDKNPRERAKFPETSLLSPSSSSLAREGSEALPGTLPERWIITRGLLHHHASLRSDVWVVHHRTTGPWQ